MTAQGYSTCTSRTSTTSSYTARTCCRPSPAVPVGLRLVLLSAEADPIRHLHSMLMRVVACPPQRPTVTTPINGLARLGTLPASGIRSATARHRGRGGAARPPSDLPAAIADMWVRCSRAGVASWPPGGGTFSALAPAAAGKGTAQEQHCRLRLRGRAAGSRESTMDLRELRHDCGEAGPPRGAAGLPVLLPLPAGLRVDAGGGACGARRSFSRSLSGGGSQPLPLLLLVQRKRLGSSRGHTWESAQDLRHLRNCVLRVSTGKDAIRGPSCPMGRCLRLASSRGAGGAAVVAAAAVRRGPPTDGVPCAVATSSWGRPRLRRLGSGREDAGGVQGRATAQSSMGGVLVRGALVAAWVLVRVRVAALVHLMLRVQGVGQRHADGLRTLLLRLLG
jgi:hypothetical protein